MSKQLYIKQNNFIQLFRHLVKRINLVNVYIQTLNTEGKKSSTNGYNKDKIIAYNNIFLKKIK